MRVFTRSILVSFFLGLIFSTANGQTAVNSGTVRGLITDPTGAVMSGAIISIENPVSAYMRITKAGADGRYQLPNVPFNSYHLTVKAQGFQSVAQDIEVRSVVPVILSLQLKVGQAETSVTVEGGQDLVENDPSFHTDIDRSLFDKLPLESQSSSVSSLVTLASPGVAADSNGLFHGLGDHAENSFSVDGQPITDQQSKVFSNQIPVESIQSLEVISGAPPAEYGDKTSLVIKVTTRSGQGVTRPTGSIRSSYGSFGSVNGGFDLGYGSSAWGNFLSVDGLKTGRFLDPPQFQVFHDKGNQQNLFDRMDYQWDEKNSVHLNLNYTRSWFQTPNSYDNLNLVDVRGNDVGSTDQRSRIQTFNIAPTYTRLVGTNAVFNLGAFVRRDAYNYYPSGNPFADFGPIQQESISQYRTLMNTGLRSDFSYVKGIHNIKVGGVYQQTFLRENFRMGIVDPDLNSPCLDDSGKSVGSAASNLDCIANGYQVNASYSPILAPYDLTRNGDYFGFHGRTVVKQLALYAQDQITKGNWIVNLGIRGDLYNGLTTAKQAEPRVGIAYNFKKTNTVVRASYARVMETPFNENLVLSSNGCSYDVIAALIPCVAAKMEPGYRNEFHAGIQQAVNRYFVVSAEYIWKYTHNAYDFSVLGNTPITFPIVWHNSKIPGFVLRADIPNTHGFTAFVAMSSVAARFFPPQVGGLGTTVGQSGQPFRIDHDEKFNETTHLQYQFGKRGPWFGLNWRYDSGLVAGEVPAAADASTPVDLTGLTAAQQMQAGLYCGSLKPTLSSPLTSCSPSQYGSTLVSIPAPGTENDDHNPPRVQSRHLFDASVGEDNLFRGERYRWSARLTVVNLTNKSALYNFLSTFSGTHYVTPRAVTGEIGFHF